MTERPLLDYDGIKALGERLNRPVSSPLHPLAGIRADLVGSNEATAVGVTVSGRNAPVLALCRALIEAGHDPATPLEAYRDATLCLRIRSLAEGAAFTVSEATSDGKPRFVPFRPFEDREANVGGRSPMRRMAEGVADIPPGREMHSRAAFAAPTRGTP